MTQSSLQMRAPSRSVLARVRHFSLCTHACVCASVLGMQLCPLMLQTSIIRGRLASLCYVSADAQSSRRLSKAVARAPDL